MFWEIIRSCGRWHEESSLEDALGIRVASDLLGRVLVGFARRTVRFYSLLGWPPFFLREVQTRSILLPTIAEVSDAVFTEQPIRRRRTRVRTERGLLDYWVFYRETLFLMEVKQWWINVGRKTPPEAASRRWEKAVRQVTAVSIGDLRDRVGLDESRIIRVALMVMPMWKGSSDKSRLRSSLDAEDVNSVLTNTMRTLNPNPNWGGIWLLHETLQAPIEIDAGWYERYHAVMFLCFIRRK